MSGCHRGNYTFGNLCKDFEAWELQLELYKKLAATESFIDFFWTTRFLPLPVWHLLLGRHQSAPGPSLP